jgi:hypothetical protein
MGHYLYDQRDGEILHKSMCKIEPVVENLFLPWYLDEINAFSKISPIPEKTIKLFQTLLSFYS